MYKCTNPNCGRSYSHKTSLHRHKRECRVTAKQHVNVNVVAIKTPSSSPQPPAAAPQRELDEIRAEITAIKTQLDQLKSLILVNKLPMGRPPRA